MQSKPLIPYGVGDLFGAIADRKRQLQRRLMNLFRGWGYGDVIPPEFEYAEFLGLAGTKLQEEMYRFFDRDGQLLALRPDITTQIARIVGTRLYDQPPPLRFCYVGEVFRYEPPRSGRQREFTQAGVELVGAGSPEADAEVLALTVSALQEAGLEDYRITLGEMEFFRGLLHEMKLSPEGEIVLRKAIDRKSRMELESLVERLDLPDDLRNAVLELPTLHGTEGVLAHARALCRNDAMCAALDRLRKIEEVLDAYGLKERISLDLSEIRGMEYYTGITFEAFTPGLGEAVASGGRYDELIGRFGHPFPAVGVALDMDLLLLAQSRQGRVSPVRKPHLLVSMPPDGTAYRLVQSARSAGAWVEVDVVGRDEESLRTYGAERGIPRIAVWNDGGFDVVEDGVKKRVVPEEWMQEVARWLGN